MPAWHLCRHPHADLSGDGARRYGGRWNSVGRPMVYTASAAALAILEVRMHLDIPPDLIPDDYVLMQIEVEDLSVEVMTAPPADPRAAGDAWLRQGRAALLQVPSLIVPETANLLINPAHPQANAARIVAVRPFVFDRRLWLPL